MKTKHDKVRYNTVAEYNNSRLLVADILTGKNFRRLKRAGKLPL